VGERFEVAVPETLLDSALEATRPPEVVSSKGQREDRCAYPKEEAP
jgi:hypothetical protein